MMRKDGNVGIFGRRIDEVYAARSAGPLQPPPLAISSPWSPQDTLVTFAVDEALAGLLSDPTLNIITREVALRVPGVKRAHNLHVRQFAEVPLFQMDGDSRSVEQPQWLTNSSSGVSPYHRQFGLGSDFFFTGWGCLSFTADMTDCLHVPYGLWHVDEDGSIILDERVPLKYRAKPVAIPVGFGENGLLTDGIDTLREARLIEKSYMDRLENPVPLTILGIPRDVWDGWTPEERKAYRDQWVDGRKSANGATALKVAEWPVDMPGQVATDLYESGRNAVRLDIANHTSTPAGVLEGSKQGGGGTDIRYSGVGENGALRNELWDTGQAKGFLLAFEARMSLDDICNPGLSIRGDRTNFETTPTPPLNPTSQD